MIPQQKIRIPGIRQRHACERYGIDVLLDRLELNSYSPKKRATIVPSGVKTVIDGYSALRPGLPSRLPCMPRKFKPIRLPDGNLFRVETNAELVYAIITATACARLGYGTADSVRISQGGLKFACDNADLMHVSPLFAEMERNSAQPTIVVWHSMESALMATAELANSHSSVMRPHNFLKIALEQVGLEITEIVLLGLAIDPLILKEPVSTNTYHNAQPPRSSKGLSLVINEAVEADKLEIMTEEELNSIDRWLVKGIKEDMKRG